MKENNGKEMKRGFPAVTECVLGDLFVCFHGVADDDSQHEEACIISILASKAVSVVYEKFPMFGCVHFRR